MEPLIRLDTLYINAAQVIAYQDDPAMDAMTLLTTGPNITVRGEERLALLAWLANQHRDLLKIWRVSRRPSNAP